jgi:membrane associated rhomboid family serine protease
VWAHPGSVVPLAGMGAPIAAVLAAYFVMFPQSRVLMLVPARHLIDAVELPAALVAAGWLTLHVLGGFGSLDVPTGRIGPIGRIGIDVWPFVGGAIAGLLAVWVARQPDRRRVEWWGP